MVPPLPLKRVKRLSMRYKFSGFDEFCNFLEVRKVRWKPFDDFPQSELSLLLDGEISMIRMP